MKKILTLAAALLVFGATASMAQGLNLHWNECGAGGGATTLNFNCASNSGAAYTMIASVFPAGPMAHFAAATAVIDVTVQGASLPQWWQTATGQCRQNAISMSFDPANNTSSCGDLWGGSLNVGVFAIQQALGGPLHGPNTFRVNGVGAIPAGSEIPVAPGSELWLCRVTIARAATTTCTGCTTPYSVVFNQCDMLSPDEPKSSIVTVGDNFCIGNPTGFAFCPGATPAVNRTWGAVKSLYR